MKIATFSIVAGTAVCNAACPFCISKQTGVKEIGLEEPEINWRNFRKACRLAQIHNVSTVLLTGKGEPTLYPEQLSRFLDELEIFQFPIIELQTNGLVFGESWGKYEPHLRKWHSLGLTTIAISAVHYDPKKNKEIYTPNREYPDLAKIIERLHEIGYSIRLTVTMIKGWIDSPEKVARLCEQAKKWGVEQLTIRPVRAVCEEDMAENQDVYNWTKKHSLGPKIVPAIKKYLDDNGHQLMALAHGAIVYDLDGQNICLADSMTIKPTTEDLRSLIFFPDGHLRYDWQYKGAVLV